MADSSDIIAIGVMIALFCAFLCASMARSKGLQPGGYFVAGLLLGVIGLIITAVAQPRSIYYPSPPPPGWYADPWGEAPLRYYDGYQWTWHLTAGPQRH